MASQEPVEFFRRFTELGMVNILDLGARVDGEPPVYQSLAERFPCEIMGIDVDPRLESDFCSQFKEPSKASYHAAILGNGSQQTWFECARASVSSTRRPDGEESLKFDGLEDPLRVLAEREVRTTRLDDFVGHHDIDFIKSDLQGSDLEVLANAPRILRQVAVIQVEVEFIRQYRYGSSFGEISSMLEANGFSFHSFIEFGTRPLSGFSYHVPESPRQFRQWLWANALFVREVGKWGQLANRKLLSFGLLMCGLFRSADYAWALLKEYDNRTNGNFNAEFLASLRKQ